MPNASLDSMRSRSQTASSGWRPGNNEWFKNPGAVEELELHVCLLEDKVRRQGRAVGVLEVAAQVLDGERLMHTALELAKRFQTSLLDASVLHHLYVFLAAAESVRMNSSGRKRSRRCRRN